MLFSQKQGWPVWKSQWQCIQWNCILSSNFISYCKRFCEGKGQILRKDDSFNSALAILIQFYFIYNPRYWCVYTEGLGWTAGGSIFFEWWCYSGLKEAASSKVCPFFYRESEMEPGEKHRKRERERERERGSLLCGMTPCTVQNPIPISIILCRICN